jgi:hypothetical protein
MWMRYKSKNEQFSCGAMYMYILWFMDMYEWTVHFMENALQSNNGNEPK